MNAARKLYNKIKKLVRILNIDNNNLQNLIRIMLRINYTKK